MTLPYRKTPICNQADPKLYAKLFGLSNYKCTLSPSHAGAHIAQGNKTPIIHSWVDVRPWSYSDVVALRSALSSIVFVICSVAAISVMNKSLMTILISLILLIFIFLSFHNLLNRIIK